MTAIMLEREINSEQLPDNYEASPGVLDMLNERWAEGKFLCVGLDVTPTSDKSLYDAGKQIIDATHDIAAAFKPNSAFYEGGAATDVEQLEYLIRYAKHRAPGVPVIWDAKRADIAKTNEGYSSAADVIGADAITLHPYLGGSALKPLLSDPKRMGIVLGHTSNPGAAEFQHLQLKDGALLWEKVVQNIAHEADWQHGSPLGVVVGATYPEELAKARHLAGDDITLLVPGIGAQGGDLEAAVRGAMNSQGTGFLINVSSGISKATNSRGAVSERSIRDAALDYHKKIHAVWQNERANPSPSYGELEITEFDVRLATALHEEGCIRFGNFVLRSGKTSPLYIDIRDSITDPTLRGNIANIYVDLVKGLEARRGEQFDVLAGIPQAVTTFGAIVADRMERRLVQPRSGVKDHGTKKLVEGKFSPGESVGLIDDLISDGGAKFDTIKQVEQAGLSVQGIALLIDREQGGFRELAARGMRTQAATTARKLVTALSENGRISKSLHGKVRNYLDSV